MRVRGRTHVEELPHDKKAIIITEVPYQVNKASLVEAIADLVKQKRVTGIVDLRDESDREGVRVVVELRRDVHEEIILNQLYAHTPLQTTFGIINLALLDGEPKVLSLLDTLREFLTFREQVVRRRTRFDLQKARSRMHIVEGLLRALRAPAKLVSLIRKAEDVKRAQRALMREFELTGKQAQAILQMQLRRLTALEVRTLKEEAETLQATIEKLGSILRSKRLRMAIVKEELLQVRDKYADERRTHIEEEEPQDLAMEDLIPNEPTVITISNTGYIKRQALEDYRKQRRGGVGLIGMETKEEDYVVDLFVTKTHNHILFFTNRGRVYWLKAWRVPKAGRRARGRPIINLLPRLRKGETIASRVAVEDFEATRFLLFATKEGKVKKTSLEGYSNPRVTGIWAIRLRKGDELVDVKPCQPTDEVILATKLGKAIRFQEAEVRPTGRYTEGVKGVNLREGDEVVGMTLVAPEDVLLTVTEGGYGKCSTVAEYRKTHRGARGVINIKRIERIGPVVAVREVELEDEILVTTEGGMIIRFPVNDVRVQGRPTMGVRIMRLKEGDRVQAMAKLATSAPAA